MVNFWDVHGIFFLIGLILIPRIMLAILYIVGNTLMGGIFFWLGWLITPHLVIAIVATHLYWHTNPVLVIFAWLLGFGDFGELKLGFEKGLKHGKK